MTNTGQQQMPGMKAMMYMMPLMFLVFFNQYASGLTYYYFISTLITIVQTLIFRYTINEDKLLAKLEANKRKPMKKSGFMKRLEEAQRAQQETLRKQQEAKKNDRIIVIVVLEKGPFICLLVDKGTFCISWLVYLKTRRLDHDSICLFVFIQNFLFVCIVLYSKD